jgi:hypothetical protein
MALEGREMTDAPERIWTASTEGKCRVGFDTPSMNYTIEYIRADLVALDAARYRWLRSRDLDAIGSGGVFAGMTPDNCVLNGADLDAAVDAGMGVAPNLAELTDPVAVHANMLRGTIAKPTVEQIVHLYGVDALCKAMAPVIVREAEAALPAVSAPVAGPMSDDLIRAAFRAGFECSAEGYNGEYPFEGQNVEADAEWCKMRDRAIAALPAVSAPVAVRVKAEAALVEAKREMWIGARSQWTMEDFKNWAVIQQIDDALAALRALGGDA